MGFGQESYVQEIYLNNLEILCDFLEAESHFMKSLGVKSLIVGLLYYSIVI